MPFYNSNWRRRASVWMGDSSQCSGDFEGMPGNNGNNTRKKGFEFIDSKQGQKNLLT
ncbi:hypothetical protein JW964_09995 [candidate division KSB1 bacterium]|nr:hypothetical protein [candidate division KSB1 bacterium]